MFRQHNTPYFRFGSRRITGTGAPTHSHPNVLRVRVHTSILQSALQTLLSWPPTLLRTWTESSFPEWLLPTSVIVRNQKVGWDEEFETKPEVTAYQKLKCLQGVVIPIFHGEVQCESQPALYLPAIGGACVAKPQALCSERTISDRCSTKRSAPSQVSVSRMPAV